MPVFLRGSIKQRLGAGGGRRKCSVIVMVGAGLQTGARGFGGSVLNLFRTMSAFEAVPVGSTASIARCRAGGFAAYCRVLARCGQVCRVPMVEQVKGHKGGDSGAAEAC